MLPACSRTSSAFVGQLDPARLAPPAHLDLGLDHNRVAGLVRLGHCLVDGVGHASGGYRNAEPGEVLLALILEEVHARSCLLLF